MINARTWHRLCYSGGLLMLSFVLLLLLSAGSRWQWVAIALIVATLAIGVIGAVYGALLIRGRRSLGCPLCQEKCCVEGGNHDGMYLQCPTCGNLRLRFDNPFQLKVIHRGSAEDDLVGYVDEKTAFWRVPLDHWRPFAIIFLPVLTSIAIASVIHRFTFFYLIIPGFWCFGVGCFLIDGIARGQISDNHGTALRARSPFRFWSKVAIWSLFYLLAAAAPIGFALQEREKLETAQHSSSVTRGSASPTVEKHH